MNFLLNNQMIMTSQDQIYTLKVLCQFNIIIFHHMRQTNNHFTLVSLSQFSDNVLSKLQKVHIVTKLFIEWIKCVNPLFLREAEKSNLHSINFFNVIF